LDLQKDAMNHSLLPPSRRFDSGDDPHVSHSVSRPAMKTMCSSLSTASASGNIGSSSSGAYGEGSRMSMDTINSSENAFRYTSDVSISNDAEMQWALPPLLPNTTSGSKRSLHSKSSGYSTVAELEFLYTMNRQSSMLSMGTQNSNYSHPSIQPPPTSYKKRPTTPPDLIRNMSQASVRQSERMTTAKVRPQRPTNPMVSQIMSTYPSFRSTSSSGCSI
jgi:hypothetical protein